MYPQQQSAGQAGGAQYLNFGVFNLTLIGELISAGTGYLCGTINVNGFAPNNSTQVLFTLTNPELGDPVNDAEVTLTVKDGNGVVILEPQILSYIFGSDGAYKDTINIPGQENGQKYYFVITAVGADGLLFECPFIELSEYCNC